MDYTPQQLIRRYEVLRSERRTVESVWDDITDLVFFHKGDMFRDNDTEHSVDWRENRDVFDSTAAFAATTLASSIHGELTSPSIQWSRFTFRDAWANDVPGAAEWLDSAGKKVYQALQDSNFNVEVSEMYQDLVGMGTSVLVEEDKGDGMAWEGVDFQCIPIRECFFESGAGGDLINFYRRHEWTAMKILDKFHKDDIPARILKQANEADGISVRHEVIFCVYTREYGPDQVKPDVHKLTPAANRPVQWRYILKDTKEVLGEGGYYEMPAYAPRWRKMSGSQWGYSPAMLALPDIKTLNQITEQGLAAGEKAIDPPLFVSERDLISDLDLTPGAINVVRNIDGITGFQNSSDYAQEVSREDRLRDSIKQAFHIDDLALKDSPAMTATEVQARMELMQRLLGPTAGRLKSDFQDPMIERTFRILWRAGQIDPLPEGLENTELDIAYTGPLARAQASDSVAAVERWVQGQASLAELHPEILDIIDFDQAARETATLLDVPAAVVRDADNVKMLRQQRQQEQQAQQQADQLQQASEMVRNVGGAEGVDQLQNLNN